MVDISELEVGMKIKIVDAWVDGCGQNNAGRMDCYLGEEVTISYISDVRLSHGYYVNIEEDGGRWYWFMPAIDCILNYNTGFSPVADISDLFGGAMD